MAAVLASISARGMPVATAAVARARRARNFMVVG
jgi:hypothetical protein